MTIIRSSLLYLTLLCLPVYLLCSCKSGSKGVTCPGFNDTAYAGWFPYSVGEVLLFKNGSNTDTFTIGHATASSSYTLSGSNATVDSCISSVLIYSNETTHNDSSYKFITRDFVPAKGGDSVNLFFYSWAFTFGGISDSGLNISNRAPLVHSNTYTNYNVQGTVYGKVQVITNDDTVVTSSSTRWIYKVYLAYGKGVVAYETFPQKATWALQ